MDNIIQQLINIENSAQNVIKDVKEFEINFDKVIDDSVNDIKNNIENRTDERINIIAVFEREDADKRIEGLQHEILKQKEKLLQKDSENHDAWVDMIFSEITSV